MQEYPKLNFSELVEMPGAALQQQHRVHRLLCLNKQQQELAHVESCAADNQLLAQVSCCKPHLHIMLQW